MYFTLLQLLQTYRQYFTVRILGLVLTALEQLYITLPHCPVLL